MRGDVVHWNIAGWARHRGDPAVAVALAEAVRRRTPVPLAVTVNEICSDQYDVLAAALAPLGFAAAAAWSIPHFGRPRAASYGIAVFWRGGDGGTERVVYPDSAQVDGAATVEKRVLVLARSATLGFAVATTHPAPRRDVAARQVAVAAEVLAAAEPPTVLGGDLNLRPSDAALDVLYADHDEAGGGSRRFACPTHVSLRKLDYVFAPRAAGVRFVSRLHLAFRPLASDHARLRVAVEVRPGRAGHPE